MKIVKKRLLNHVVYLIKKRLYIAFYWKAPWAMPRISHPRVIEIELSNDCNLSCVHCHRRLMVREPGNMELPVFKKLIDEIAEYPFVSLLMVGQGESSLNPQFSEMMRYASGKSIKIELTTNGSIFELYSFEEILQWDIDVLGISLDGKDKTSYQQIRKGGNYDKLESNIREFYAFRNKNNKKYPLVCLRNVIFPENTPQQIEHFKETWNDTVDLITFNTLSTFQKPINYSWLDQCRCNELFFDAHVRFDGSVILCQHECLYGKDEVIGNIKTDSLRHIQTSERIKERRLLHYKRDLPLFCKRCLSDCKNPEVYANSRKYNMSRNIIINMANRYLSVT